MIIWRGLFSCKLDAINSLVKDDVSLQEMSTLRVFVRGFLPLFGDEFFKQNCVRQSVFGTDTGRSWVFFGSCAKRKMFSELGTGDLWFYQTLEASRRTKWSRVRLVQVSVSNFF
jgi:hypothetical protein